MNFIGLSTLYKKEVKRFLSIIVQTIISPLINTALFVTVFYFSLGQIEKNIMGIDVPYINFIIPGLIAMSILQNAFTNNGASIMLSKIYGNIVDIITSPLTSGEILIAWTMAGVTRSIIIAMVNVIFFASFTDFTITFIPWFLIFLLLGSCIMAIAGVIVGICANNFNEFSLISEFFVTPLTFLSGTFFNIALLPNVLQTIIACNPIFYVVDGIRYSVIGVSYANPWLGLVFLSITLLVLWIIAYTILRTGYKLKT